MSESEGNESYEYSEDVDEEEVAALEEDDDEEIYPFD